MKNIALAKYGKSIKFDSPYSPVGGDAEAPHTFQALARLNPDKTFYLIGRSDYGRLTSAKRSELFPHDNVVDCYDKFNKSCRCDRAYTANFINEYMEEENITIDYGIIFMGQVGTVTVPDRIKKVKNQNEFAAIIEMSLHYSSAISHYLNTSMIPWVEILTDVRLNINQARDVFNPPRYSLGQQSVDYKLKHIRNYEDQSPVFTPIHTEYADIEKTICLFYDKPDRSYWHNKTNTIITISNQINHKRYDLHRKWVIDNFHDYDVSLYGKWDDPRAIEDPRFKGPTSMEHIQALLRRHKYSIILPVHSGWVTAKYIEILGAGCIPFMHPSYDSVNNHLDLPDVIRPKTPEELRKTIDAMEADDNYRLGVLEMLTNRYIKDSFYDGTFINEVIFTKIDPTYKAPVVDLSAIEGPVTINDFF